MKNKIVELGISEREADELIKVSYNIEEDYNKLLKKYSGKDLELHIFNCFFN